MNDNTMAEAASKAEATPRAEAASKRLHLRFSMQRAEQREAYAILAAIPQRRRMEYLCTLINKGARGVDVEQRVLSAVRLALQDYRPQFAPEKEEGETGEIPQQMMDFLGSL